MPALTGIIIAFYALFIFSVSISQSKEKIVLKDEYKRVQFIIVKKKNKTIIKDRDGFTVKKIKIKKQKNTSSYFRFNNKKVK